jgi:putative FmdB family regulatory protein
MPTYEYACTSCGHHLEVVQSFSDAALTTCPLCQGPLRKVFGNVGIVLKGSGFYKTDNRTSANGASARPESKSSSETTTSTDSSKDSTSSSKDAVSTTASSSTSSPEKASTG